MIRRTSAMKVLAVAISLITLAWAQSVDFSGTWVRDKEKSDPMQMGRRGGDGGGGGPAPNLEVTLVIKQADNDFQVSRKISRDGQERVTDQKFTLDGKENTNTAPAMGRGGASELKSKSKWSKSKLVIDGTQKINTPNGEMEIGIKDEYSLSADGKVLTVMTNRSTPMGEQTSKQLYNKQ